LALIDVANWLFQGNMTKVDMFPEHTSDSHSQLSNVNLFYYNTQGEFMTSLSFRLISIPKKREASSVSDR
jgi:hypothetical protein